MTFEADGRLKTLTSNTQTEEWQTFGPVWLSLSNDFGGGTAVLQRYSEPNDAWVDVVGASYTEAADDLIDFPPGAKNRLRVSLTGASDPDLDCEVQSTGVR